MDTTALAKFRNNRFDLVLVDRSMPDMTGDQVAAAIKSANPRVPVVMLTSSASMMDDADEKLTGVDFIVGKPVTIEGLRAAVSKAAASANQPTRPARGYRVRLAPQEAGGRMTKCASLDAINGKGIACPLRPRAQPFDQVLFQKHFWCVAMFCCNVAVEF